MTLLAFIVAIASDGERLFVARPGGVDVYRDGKVAGSLGTDTRRVNGLAWRDGRLAECGGVPAERGEVRLWRDDRLVWRTEAHVDVIYEVAWSADGTRLYTAGGDRRIGVIDAATGKVTGYLEGHTGPVLALAVRGDVLVSGGADRTIRVWKGGRAVRTINNHWEAVHALAWSPDGRYLASGSADRTVRVWQPVIGRLVRIVKGHDGAVLDLVWTDAHLVSAASDGKVRFIAPDDVTIEREVDAGADWVHALGWDGSRIWHRKNHNPNRLDCLWVKGE